MCHIFFSNLSSFKLLLPSRSKLFNRLSIKLRLFIVLLLPKENDYNLLSAKSSYSMLLLSLSSKIFSKFLLIDTLFKQLFPEKLVTVSLLMSNLRETMVLLSLISKDYK